MFPNLPTDNLYKFLCIGGLALIVISCLIYVNSNDGLYEISERQYRVNTEYLKKLTDSVYVNSENYALDSTDNSFSNIIWNARVESYSVQSTASKVLFIFGAGLFIWGLIWWYRDQKVIDALATLNHIKSLRQYTECQSCSTGLKFSEIDSGKIFCSHCHNGYGYVEPQMTLDEMKDQVRAHMLSKGYGEIEIVRQTEIISKLYRWNSEFKWE